MQSGSVNGFLGIVGDGLGNAFQMAWEVWWALILGFLLSGVVHAWVSQGQMQRVLGGRSLASTLRGTALVGKRVHGHLAVPPGLDQPGGPQAPQMVGNEVLGPFGYPAEIAHAQLLDLTESGYCFWLRSSIAPLS